MIEINNLQKTIGSENLLEVDRLIINKNDKIGLIGDNGAGKSTFLKILAGLDDEFSGEVRKTVSLAWLLNEKEEISLDHKDLKNEEHYSPGEKQKIKLMKVLKNKGSFLLLDEPTSHLDITQKEALVEKLKNRSPGFLLISHDRDFINQSCNKVFELQAGKIEVYNGNYAFYLEEKEKRKKCAEREYQSYIHEKKRLLHVAKDVKKQSSKIRTTPKRMGNSEARLHKMGGQENKKKLDKQVKAIYSRIEHLEVKEKPQEETPIVLTMPEKDKIHSKILIEAENLNSSFGKKQLFQQARFSIENNHKTALIGDNGTGKTTLLKQILERKEIVVHPNLRMGYYSQMDESLEIRKSVLDNVLHSSIYDQTMTRIVLARLGFKNEDVLKKIEVLSDGERAKIKLAKLLTSNFNYLILDEPTNFLDIRAIESLEDLLIHYDRGLLFVSHDISLINKVANHLLMIEGGQIKSFKGNLKQYQAVQERQKKKETEEDILLEFKITSLNARLSNDLAKDEREVLEKEYKDLIARKRSKEKIKNK